MARHSNGVLKLGMSSRTGSRQFRLPNHTFVVAETAMNS